MAKVPSSSDVTGESTLVPSSLSSCLRSGNKPAKDQLNNRSVSFPDDDSQIVTGYLEPVNPWFYAESTTKEIVITNYLKSCRKHGVEPIIRVLNLLEELPYTEGGERVRETLNLKGENLTLESCEALEEVLKRVQFEKLNLENTGLDDEASVAIFDMIEYYEAASHLNISSNMEIGLRGWQACSRMLKRTKCLEQLECKNTPLNESLIPLLSRALRLGTQLQVLKLENCSLTDRPIVILAAALKLNTTLKELYLAENDLTPCDAVQLAGMLKCNVTLQLLDVSNNGIEDSGVGHICDALCEQSQPSGLSILILWNNQLKTSCSPHINRMLRLNNVLEMLNVGHNVLKDEFLYEIKESLTQNKSILRLGMQSTQLTSDGAVTLAQIINGNPTLQRIDLRDNDLNVAGLLALATAMKTNTSITQLDIDDYPRTKYRTKPRLIQNGEGDGFVPEDTMEKYMSLLEEMRNYCSRNESGGDDAMLRAQLCSIAARKISLTCDTSLMNRLPIITSQQNSTFLSVETGRKSGSGGRLRSPAPSPIPSPVASPSPTRTRFQVSKVAEDSSSDNIFFGTSRSRFRVTTVSDSDDSSSSRVGSYEEPQPHLLQCQTIPQPRRSPPSTACPTPPAESTPPRSRKLSWMNTGIFVEAKAASGIEKLLGLFQNPFSVRGGGQPNEEHIDCGNRRVESTNNNSSADGRSNSVSVVDSNEGGHQSGGATWPQASSVLRPTPPSPVQSATSAPSLTALAAIKPTG